MKKRKRKRPLYIVDDPHHMSLEDVKPATVEKPLEVTVATDDDPRIVTADDKSGTRLKVSREIGTCDRCKTEEVHTITAYDPGAYEGRVCGPCILAGKATEDHEVDSPLMRPMVFVARALAGQEPYRTLLRAADEQRDNPAKADTIEAIAKARHKSDSKARHRARKLGLVETRVPKNRKERRIAAKQKRKRDALAARETKAETAKAKAKANGAAQLDDFEAFAEGWK